jgi:VIT1/CCC1 family predicted Fe2+/Mn2+ transporter
MYRSDMHPLMPVHTELHAANDSGRLNWLRAAVLGANDGIVSVAALVVGVAGASVTSGHILITGIAGLLAGALSMAAGEYVSVSTQRDTEEALLAKEKWELENEPEKELEELTVLYQQKGLSRETAERAAQELTKHDALGAHLETELHIDPDNLTNPWHAAIASALSFVAGAVIPLLAISLPPENMRIALTFASVIIALAITGSWSARIGGAPVAPATVRVVIGGVIAMAITYGIGALFGVEGV